MYQLEANESSEAGIKRIAIEVIDETINSLTVHPEELDQSIHEFRKSMKRMRALVRMVRDEIGEENYRRENNCFRDASRMLSILRDSAVMVETFDLLRNYFADQLQDDTFLNIRQKLLDRHIEKRNQFYSKPDITLEAIDMLRQAREHIREYHFGKDDFDSFAAGLKRVYRRSAYRMERAYANPDHPEIFHDWRKRVKYLWHQYEILNQLSPEIFNLIGLEVKYISDLLGDAHDLVVLKHLLMEEDEFQADPDVLLLLKLISQRHVELETAARPYGLRMFADTPKAFVHRMRTYWRVWKTHGINSPPVETSLLEEIPDLLSVKAAADLLDISTAQVRALIQNEAITAIKVGRTWAIYKDSLVESETN